MVFSIKVFQSMADNVKAIIREDNSQVGWLAASLNFHRVVPQNQHFVRSRASNNSSLSLRKINPLNCEYSRNSSFSRIVCICHFASIGLPKRGACLTLWRPVGIIADGVSFSERSIFSFYHLFLIPRDNKKCQISLETLVRMFAGNKVLLFLQRQRRAKVCLVISQICSD